jgi:hypothetical protein
VSPNGERLTQIQFSTTYQLLPEEVALVVGYELQASHHCMECGERVGAGSMLNHARLHAGLAAKPKASKRALERPGAVQ